MNDATLFTSDQQPFTNVKFYTKYDSVVPEEVHTLLEPESNSFNKIVDYAKDRGQQLFTKFDGYVDSPTGPLR